MSHYDVIVVGVGGIGSATLFHLARRGVRVLGLDRFPPGHDRGSSHGRTRLIRRAYFEHPSYVPLVERAFEEWALFEELRGEKFLHVVGLLQVGPAEGSLVRGVLESAATHALDVQSLSPAEAMQRFPGFLVEDDTVAVFEKGAGYLDVEAAVTAYADEAVKAGAELRVGGAVRSWTAAGGGVSVDTESRTFTADRLVVTPGPWAKDLLIDLCIPFEVRRKPLYWYPTNGDHYRPERCPGYVFETLGGIFYGFPQVDKLGVKVGEHSGGVRIADPLGIDRGVDPQDQKRVEAFVAQHLTEVKRRCVQHVVCMYTMSPDTHFVVDRHPHHDNVVFAAGFSGHGYKFASVLGSVLADMALEGKKDPDVEFLHCDRPGLRFTDID